MVRYIYIRFRERKKESPYYVILSACDKYGSALSMLCIHYTYEIRTTKIRHIMQGEKNDGGRKRGRRRARRIENMGWGWGVKKSEIRYYIKEKRKEEGRKDLKADQLSTDQKFQKRGLSNYILVKRKKVELWIVHACIVYCSSYPTRICGTHTLDAPLKEKRQGKRGGGREEG